MSKLVAVVLLAALAAAGAGWKWNVHKGGHGVARAVGWTWDGATRT